MSLETDADYQREARQILAEFGQSDWEAWGKSQTGKRRRNT